MRPMSRLVGAAALAMVLTACGVGSDTPLPSASASEGASASASASQTAAAGLDLQPLDSVSPVDRPKAGIGMAFDDAGAAKLVEQQAQIDYDERALLCVYLGKRTGRWTFDLQSATLDGQALEIDARERPPRQPGGEQTLPAACATLARAALPVGQLTVSAHDTVSDEVITEGSVEVPAASGGS
jgi:hypothetical protein